MSESEWPYGYGMCCCGCGQETNIAEYNNRNSDVSRGEPYHYIRGHSRVVRWERLPEIFWPKVDRSDLDGCWPWTGVVLGNGYGEVYIDRKSILSHRAAYILGYGDIPEGLVVRHLCNNRICCRPDHLAVGTYQDNADDMTRADRQARGEDHGSHVLTNGEALEIYARCMRKDGTRAAIAEDYGVARVTVNDIALGRTWGWLTGKVYQGEK